MSIKREADDLPTGELVMANRVSGEDVVDHEEYEEMIDDNDVVFPVGHTAAALTRDEMFPGYDPDER